MATTAETPPVEAASPIDELEVRLAKLRRRESATAKRLAEIDSRIAEIDREAEGIRLARETDELPPREAAKALAELDDEARALAAERPGLLADSETRATVIAELEARLVEERRALVLADAGPLVARELEVWMEAGKRFAALVDSFDDLVEIGRELEAVRSALPADQRDAVASPAPWTPDVRSFVVFLAELSTNRMRRDYQRAVGDPRVELVPDLTSRLDEAHAFEGVESWRYIPG
jgi:hypothetical protein